jgi:hypothetical protein
MFDVVLSVVTGSPSDPGFVSVLARIERIKKSHLPKVGGRKRIGTRDSRGPKSMPLPTIPAMSGHPH